MTTAAGVYSSVIRERWRRPRFRGVLAGATVTAEDVNPLCGDRIRLALRLEGPMLAEARFTGDSCAICAASADVLLETVQGKSVADAVAVTTEDLLTILEADIRPTRMKCVTLPLSALKAALHAS
ncbi:MAG: Fe-S cluster protein [Candidatus Rokuibacteriota bacterium]|nr:MAG: Fe-S cluster protein [Candidatus Rokubacteria bacterium]